MLERPIKAFVNDPRVKGRKAISLNTLLESFRAMVEDPDFTLPLFSFKAAEIEVDEDVLTPDTMIVFALEGEWGELKIEYTPGMKALGTLFEVFDEAMSNPVDVMKCLNHSYVQLVRKLPRNLDDAMIGLLDEAVYETLNAATGRQVMGRMDRKGLRDQTAEKHAQRSRARMGARRGKVAKPEEWVKKVIEAGIRVEGRITREKVAEKMGLEVSAFDQQVEAHHFKWTSELRELIERKRKVLAK